ncbi:uncharacterized protein B0H18DRAFT_1206675 [Fomitopsis serialis]|uniref:uncharacterized protein n=1 Tax=Fomitopsis serialis TaxID=139415 RepID=UPI002008A241|nr:uncharacterized protein B0H18DRAFT_1206675 [Neoantrodia serialis]KAH9936312.1 hypothetical protein B0H18DRAFT_1206675 [Neoantrodia serialis]
MPSAPVGNLSGLTPQNQDVFCSINHLPKELLIEIFLTVYDCAGDDGWDMLLPEVTISHVSKLWHLRYNQSAIYLERSKEAPLQILIDFKADEGAAETSDVIESLNTLDAIMTQIIPHISHWYGLHIIVSDYSMAHRAFIRMGACISAPMLEMLQIANYPRKGVGENERQEFRRHDFILFHGHAPKLSTSTFGCHAKDVRPSFKDFARILCNSPELERLSLCKSGPADLWFSGHGVHPAIPLPSLRELEFVYSKSMHMNHLIERLALPNLASLSIRAVTKYHDASGTALLETLTRPSPATGRSVLSKLRELKLTAVECSEPAVVAGMFAELTELRSLSLHQIIFMPWENVLIAQWESIARSNEVPLLPRLEMLTTTCLSGEFARKLIKARKATRTPFKKVFISRPSDFTKKDKQWIQDHVDTFGYYRGSYGEVIMETEGVNGMIS